MDIDDAVEIVRNEMRRPGGRANIVEWSTAALAREKWLISPARRAALEAVADVANRYYVKPEQYEHAMGVALRRLSALDAAPGTENES
jgi:hypothetical protein